MLNTKVNWWRVVAIAAVPLFLYTTWQYAEAQARYTHLLEHVRKTSHATHAPAAPATPSVVMPPKAPVAK